MRRTKEETNETIQKITQVARQHFTDKGYNSAALEEIAHEAELTRGALYHHFRSKKGLFQAVLEEVQQEVARRVEAEAAQSEDMWEQLLLGCRAFVAAAVEPNNKRIMLLDGPSVFGWDVWREMDEQNAMRLLREQLVQMQQQGFCKDVAIEPLVHALSGALNEVALWIAQQPGEGHSLEQAMTVVELLLEGVKCK